MHFERKAIAEANPGVDLKFVERAEKELARAEALTGGEALKQAPYTLGSPFSRPQASLRTPRDRD